MNHRRAWSYLKLAIGLGLLGLLIWTTNVSALYQEIRAADLFWCLLGASGFIGLTVFEILRMHGLLQHYPLTRRRAGAVFLISKFFGNFVPGSLGAEVYKLAALRQILGETLTPIAHLIVLRFAGLATSVLLAIVMMSFSFPRWQREFTNTIDIPALPWNWIIPSCIASLIVGMIVYAMPASSGLRRRIRASIGKLFGAWRQINSRQTLVLFLWSVAAIASRATGLWCFVNAVGGDIRFDDIIVIIAIVNVASLLPISFAALGVREGVMAFLLSGLGLPIVNAVSVGLLSRAVMWLTSLVGGALWLNQRQQNETHKTSATTAAAGEGVDE